MTEKIEWPAEDGMRLPYYWETRELTPIEEEIMKYEYHYGPKVDPKQDKVCKDAAEDRRRQCLDLAYRYGGFSEPQRVDDVIEDAIKIEAYLRGELDAPNRVEVKLACMCKESVECGECAGVVRP